uniref:Uncharacterized protein n=1 Tax=Arundo donax TaxID=35708 RepID=A0A0A9C812_ARUDO
MMFCMEGLICQKCCLETFLLSEYPV